MEDTSENKQMKHKKHISIALLAHVDAGKTTLSESLLYLSGAIRKAGRVDHQDTFLDTHALERARGITIFSKQAVFALGEKQVTLLDTPGHADFSAEMERTLQVLDYAVLIISGTDGVQGHTETLWRLLRRYEIPVFLFVNKMDQPGTDREKILAELQKRLDGSCMDFSGDMRSEDALENLAMCDEVVLDRFLESGSISEGDICAMIKGRKVFPCYFGSALKMTGVETFMAGLAKYALPGAYRKEFGAKVYKISRDEQGNRLTYLKVTGGSLKVKAMLTNRKDVEKTEPWEEKVNQIRIYSGPRFETAEEAEAGTVCAVTGLTKTYPGQGLGAEPDSALPLLEPVLTYGLELPPECDAHTMLSQLRKLEEEEPKLHVVWDERAEQIQVQLMGEVQTEVLRSLIYERFGVHVRFGAGSIVYKETIRETVEGVGHFEPLRHYAEVHLLLEPQEAGSGMHFDTGCSEDVLDGNWQRLVLTHLAEKEFPGVLTGSPITDMKITLIAGRAHQKHTEGGDFRQATYRAVRQGLKMSESILLEPCYAFRMELPAEMTGRAMSDVQKMHGSFDAPLQEGDICILTGRAPVATMRDYQRELLAYTGGRGRISCTLQGYAPCHNQEEVVAACGYDAEHDLENPTGSVFCAHGAGFVVPWDRVRDYMHVDSGIRQEAPKESEPQIHTRAKYEVRQKEYWENEKELETIFERTYGAPRKERSQMPRKVTAAPSPEKPYRAKAKNVKQEYLLVDGYNIIFAWDELKALAGDNLGGARDKLMEILSNYQGYRRCNLILVFDAYKVSGGTGSVQKYHNIHVVYTKEAETADQYIEKVAHEIGRKYDVTVATSDGLEQVIILGQGCRRLSAKDLQQEIQRTRQQIREEIRAKRESDRNYLLGDLPEELEAYMEEVRLGKRNPDESVE